MDAVLTRVVSTLAFVDTVQIYFRRLHPDAASIPSELFSEVVASNKGGGGRVSSPAQRMGRYARRAITYTRYSIALERLQTITAPYCLLWMMAEQVGCIDMRQWLP